jgi:peptide/nickel transport system permease protein
MSVDQAAIDSLTPSTAIIETQEPLKRKSPFKKLWQDKVARVALIVLVFLYICAMFADFFAPYSMYFNDPDLANAPPTSVYIQDENGNWRWPYVFAVKRTFNPETFSQSYSEDSSKAYPIKLFIPGESYRILGIIPGDIHLFGVEAPARLFLLGSDINGRDNWSRLFFGAQKSLTIGFLGLFISYPIGIVYGAISGFAGGLVDNIMMRIAEAVMSIPSFYLLIGLAAILPPGMSGSQRFALITVILSFIGWASLARVIRGMVLSIREEEFVQAARAVGMPEFITIVKHVVPQTMTFIIISATLQVPSFILSESGLSFIGLGIQQPDASWGNMLTAAMDNVNDLLNQPWLIAPGICIFITILCFNTLGDVLRDVLDPRMQGVV